MGEAFFWQIRLKKEQEEKERRRKEKAEAHLYTIIKVRVLMSFLMFTALSSCCVHSSGVLTGWCNSVDDHKNLDQI
jgi:hypothetical protein